MEIDFYIISTMQMIGGLKEMQIEFDKQSEISENIYDSIELLKKIEKELRKMEK